MALSHTHSGSSIITCDSYKIAIHISFAAPLQAWSGPEGSRKLGFPDFLTTVQYNGKFVSLTHRPPLPPGNNPGTHSVRGWVDPRAIVRSEELGRRKNPVKPSGIEPATFRFVAQYLNHCDTAVGVRSLLVTRLKLLFIFLLQLRYRPGVAQRVPGS
jgi:hypothetical protein